MDVLANALNAIKMAEEKGKSEARVKPASKTIREVLLALQKNGYLGEFEYVDDGKSGEFIVKLVGKINKCGSVKPHYPVKSGDWESFEQRFLPAKNIGLLIVSTSQGVLTHAEAKEKNVGGRIIAFVY